MRVLFFWSKPGAITVDNQPNPYAGLLAGPLKKQGFFLEGGDYHAFSRAWLEEKRQDFQVLHFNWLHRFYLHPDQTVALDRCTEFIENLSFAARLGYRIVWTMHNEYPHERPHPQIDHLVRLAVCRFADEVITHCDCAAQLVGRLFHRSERIHVIPHGNFIDVFPNHIPRHEARKQLNIPEDAFVYISFGNFRRYKGIDNLITAFGDVAAWDARLVLMLTGLSGTQRVGIKDRVKHLLGRASAEYEMQNQLAAVGENDQRIHTYLSPYFPNEEFQVYLNSADVAVLPFAKILTSGSAITALSFGKPVILPRLGCMPELVDDSMGILYDPENDKALGQALVDIRGRDLEATAVAALNRAKALDWGGIALQFARVYQNLDN